MLRATAITVFALIAGLGTTIAEAFPRYPRVYGATGRPYGPTQARYQYRRQYGRPWHGYGGINTSYRFASPYGYNHYRSHHYSFGAYGYGGIGYSNYYYRSPSYYRFGVGISGLYGSIGFNPFYYGLRSGFNNCYVPRFSTYGPVYYGSYSAPAAVIVPRNQAVIVQPVIGQPVAGQRIIGAIPFNNAALKNALNENDRRWNQPVNVKPAEKRNVRRAKPSSLAAKRSSMKLQVAGDVYLRKQEYDKAAMRYRSALFFANDRAEAHIRLGYAQTASGQYSAAVASFKNALVLDANWPMKGESIGKVFGRENEIAFTQILGNVTRWAKADIRDSNRLFLLGVLLHFSNQTEKSSLVFTAAYRLAGHGNHLVAFLTPKRVNSKPAAKIEILQPVGVAKVPDLPADPKLTPPAPPIPPPLNPQARPKQNGSTLIVPPLPKL